jgi:hypothetical protein
VNVRWRRLGEWLLVMCLLGVALTWRPPSPYGEHEPIWRESWSERFPGCVATVLWPPAERPVAVVTRDPAGRVARVDVARATVGDARTVGACRRP